MRIQKIAKESRRFQIKDSNESERFLAAEDQKAAYHFPPSPPPPNPTHEKSKK